MTRLRAPQPGRSKKPRVAFVIGFMGLFGAAIAFFGGPLSGAAEWVVVRYQVDKPWIVWVASENDRSDVLELLEPMEGAFSIALWTPDATNRASISEPLLRDFERKIGLSSEVVLVAHDSNTALALRLLVDTRVRIAGFVTINQWVDAQEALELEYARRLTERRGLGPLLEYGAPPWQEALLPQVYETVFGEPYIESIRFLKESFLHEIVRVDARVLFLNGDQSRKAPRDLSRTLFERIRALDKEWHELPGADDDLLPHWNQEIRSRLVHFIDLIVQSPIVEQDT